MQLTRTLGNQLHMDKPRSPNSLVITSPADHCKAQCVQLKLVHSEVTKFTALARAEQDPSLHLQYVKGDVPITTVHVHM